MIRRLDQVLTVNGCPKRYNVRCCGVKENSVSVIPLAAGQIWFGGAVPPPRGSIIPARIVRLIAAFED